MAKHYYEEYLDFNNDTSIGFMHNVDNDLLPKEAVVVVENCAWILNCGDVLYLEDYRIEVECDSNGLHFKTTHQSYFPYGRLGSFDDLALSNELFMNEPDYSRSQKEEVN